jgi:hypothetical protein
MTLDAMDVLGAMNPDAFRLANGEIDGPIWVGRVSTRVASQVGASDTAVWLSRDTLLKQLHNHPEFGLEIYGNLDWLIRLGEFVADRRPGCFLLFSGPNADTQRRTKAALKVVRPSAKIMLLSVHTVRPRDYERYAKHSPKK